MLPRHFVILGAGITGLAAGWFIKQKMDEADQLTIIDHSDRVGGWIHTLKINDFLFEQGPRSCRTKYGTETLALIEALQLKNEIITPHPSSRHRYLFHHQLQQFPSQIWKIPFHPFTQGWTKAFWNDLTQPKRSKEDESIADFFTRRLSADWVERLIDPFVLGIYAGDCHRLSLKSCFPLFDEWEQTKGSLLKGAFNTKQDLQTQSAFIQSMQSHPLYSFKNGMSTLTQTLQKRLHRHLRLKCEIQQVLPHSRGLKLSIMNEEIIHGTHLISTIPAFQLKKLLPDFSQELDWLSYASVAVVNIGFNHIDIPLNGFGYLVPSAAKTPVMGCVWDSSIFPQHNSHVQQVRLTMMLGGINHPEIVNFNDNQLIELSLKALKHHCGIKNTPQLIQIHRAKQAIPQYALGYEKWKSEISSKIKKTFPSLYLSGSTFSGVSINDCIKQAQELTKDLTTNSFH